MPRDTLNIDQKIRCCEKKDDGTRNKSYFTIRNIVSANGASVICYEADKDTGKRGVFKELYPQDAICKRDENGQLSFASAHRGKSEELDDMIKQRLDNIKELRKVMLCDEAICKMLPDYEMFYGCDEDATIIGTGYLWDTSQKCYSFAELCRDERIQEKKLEVVVKAMIILCEGIKLLHDQLFVHADIKPENIGYQFGINNKFDENIVYLFDSDSFIFMEDIDRDIVETLVFTEGYIPPEVLEYIEGHDRRIMPRSEALRPDPKWDYYAIGATMLYGLVACENPSDWDFSFSYVKDYARIEDIVRGLTFINETIPADRIAEVQDRIIAFFKKSLGKKEERFDDIKEMISALQCIEKLVMVDEHSREINNLFRQSLDEEHQASILGRIRERINDSIRQLRKKFEKENDEVLACRINAIKALRKQTITQEVIEEIGCLYADIFEDEAIYKSDNAVEIFSQYVTFIRYTSDSSDKMRNTLELFHKKTNDYCDSRSLLLLGQLCQENYAFDLAWDYLERAEKNAEKERNINDYYFSLMLKAENEFVAGDYTKWWSIMNRVTHSIQSLIDGNKSSLKKTTEDIERIKGIANDLIRERTREGLDTSSIIAYFRHSYYSFDFLSHNMLKANNHFYTLQGQGSEIYGNKCFDSALHTLESADKLLSEAWNDIWSGKIGEARKKQQIVVNICEIWKNVFPSKTIVLRLKNINLGTLLYCHEYKGMEGNTERQKEIDNVLELLGYDLMEEKSIRDTFQKNSEETVELLAYVLSEKGRLLYDHSFFSQAGQWYCSAIEMCDIILEKKPSFNRIVHLKRYSKEIIAWVYYHQHNFVAAEAYVTEAIQINRGYSLDRLVEMNRLFYDIRNKCDKTLPYDELLPYDGLLCCAQTREQYFEVMVGEDEDIRKMALVYYYYYCATEKNKRFEESLALLNRAEKIASSAGYIYGDILLRIHIEKAKRYINRGNEKKAGEELEAGKKVYDNDLNLLPGNAGEIRHRLFIVWYFYLWGRIKQRKNDNTNALSFYNKCCEVYKNYPLDNVMWVIKDVCYRQSEIYGMMGYMDLADSLRNEAIKLYKKLADEDKERVSFSLSEESITNEE